MKSKNKLTVYALFGLGLIYFVNGIGGHLRYSEIPQLFLPHRLKNLFYDYLTKDSSYKKLSQKLKDLGINQVTNYGGHTFFEILSFSLHPIEVYSQQEKNQPPWALVPDNKESSSSIPHNYSLYETINIHNGNNIQKWYLFKRN